MYKVTPFCETDGNEMAESGKRISKIITNNSIVKFFAGSGVKPIERTTSKSLQGSAPTVVITIDRHIANSQLSL